MNNELNGEMINRVKAISPEKFPPEAIIFRKIHPGDRLFIGTACGEPQYLVQALINYVRSYPKAFFDTEVLQVFTLGLAPYTDIKFKDIFRHNSFFIGYCQSSSRICQDRYCPNQHQYAPGAWGFIYQH